jgi:hypothetical protein
MNGLAIYICTQIYIYTNIYIIFHCNNRILFTIKRNACVAHAITWMNLGNIRLGERSQSHQTTLLFTPFKWNVQHIQNHKERKNINGSQDLGGRR